MTDHKETITLLISNHAQKRFIERFGTDCNLDRLNSRLNHGYFFRSDQLYIYFKPYNVLLSIDEKDLPDKTFAVKTFIPRDSTYINCDYGTKVNVLWSEI